VTAFAKGERETLRPLLTLPVYAVFEAAIAEREAAGRTETVEFLQPPRADLEETAVEGETARIKVRFLAEFRSRTKGPEGEGVDARGPAGRPGRAIAPAAGAGPGPPRFPQPAGLGGGGPRGGAGHVPGQLRRGQGAGLEGGVPAGPRPRPAGRGDRQGLLGEQ